MQESKASRVFLVAAVVLGVLATIVAFTWLEQAGKIDKVDKVKVMAAKHDLRPNQLVDPSKDLEEIDMPLVEKTRPWLGRALLPAEKEGYKDLRVNRAVYAGQIVMKADFAGQITDPMEFTGELRGLAIPAKGANALGGNLVPGDYVKLFVTRPVFTARGTAIDADPTASLTTQPAASSGTASRQWEAASVIAEPVRVLAVGNRLARNRVAPTFADMHESMGQGEAQATVTLEVTEKQAKTILESTGAGTLPVTLVLCPNPAIEKKK